MSILLSQISIYIHTHICIIIITTTTKYYSDKITKQSDDEGLMMTKNWLIIKMKLTTSY
jgi:hypothetical protein